LAKFIAGQDNTSTNDYFLCPTVQLESSSHLQDLYGEEGRAEKPTHDRGEFRIGFSHTIRRELARLSIIRLMLKMISDEKYQI